MNNSDSIRIGFIGAGAIARSRHLPNLAKLPGVQVVAVANRSRPSSESIARDFNIPEIADDWRQMIQRPDLDAIFIGTWPYVHKEMSIAVLEAGKHCFCQARMAMDLDEGEQMLRVARRHRELVNMICPPPTRMPFEPFIRQTLAKGELGPITLVELHSVSGANLNRNSVHWRERGEFSGKQVLAMGIFAETLNAWVGPYEELSARVAAPIASKRDESGQEVTIDVPQAVSITGRLKNGALAVEHHSGLAADKSTPGSQITLWGLSGTLRYDFGKTIYRARAGEELHPVDVPAELQRDWRVEEDFVNAVRAARRGEKWSVSPDFAEGLLYMRKVEAVHKSAATGRAVKLDRL